VHSKDRQFIKGFFIVMIAAIFLAGCSGNLFSYKGSKITQESLMVRLQDGNQQGVWRSNELAIMYRYQMSSQVLKLSGTAELAGGNKYFSHIAVYLLALDDQGVIMADTLIYSGENSRRMIMIPMDFEKTIPLPEGAMAISFAYDITPFLSNGK
jgi:hypothetical protein